MNTTTSSATARLAVDTRSRVRLVLSVFKLRIATLIMITALGGVAIVQGGSASLAQVIVLALCVLVAAGSAGGINQFVEAESDRLMPRTRGRAFASGALPRSAAWLTVIVMLGVVAVTTCAWWVNGTAAFYVGLGAVTYAGVYTLGLKRRTAWNIVIGGLSGSFAVLAGAAAANPSITPAAWVLALVLFLWTPPHFWSLAIASEADYRAAGVPMLPVVVGAQKAARIVHASTLMLVSSILLLLPFVMTGGAGWPVAVGAIAGGAHFLRKTAALRRDPNRKTAMAAFFASMLQLSALLAGVALDAAMR